MLELLVAMAVLAIVIGLFSFTLLNWLQRQRLNEAAQLVFTELRAVRRDAQKSGVRQSITWNNLTFHGKALPNGVQLVTPFTAGVAYDPPFGTAVTPMDDGFSFQLQSPNGQQVAVDMVGVTGKAMIKW